MPKEILDWKPIKDYPDYVFTDIAEIRDSYSGLRVTVLDFNNKSRKFKFFFKRVLAFRTMDESFTVNFIEPKIQGGLYQLGKSKYLEWFHKSTWDNFKMDNPIHFGILSASTCIEVICYEMPEFTIIEKRKK